MILCETLRLCAKPFPMRDVHPPHSDYEPLSPTKSMLESRMTKATGATRTAPKTGRAKAPAQPKPARAHGRSISDFPKLNAAEKKLIACCAHGETCVLGDGTRPEEFSEERKVRAGLIRFLVLGGDDATPVHESGVWLEGAWIVDELELTGVHANRIVSLMQCHFVEQPIALNARLVSLLLSGSRVPGLLLNGLRASGDVFLREQFLAEGPVFLSGSHIEGNLECSDGHFNFSENDGSSYREDGMFQGRSLHASGIVIEGALFLDAGATFDGSVDFSAAQIGSLADDIACWPSDQTILDGLCYDRISQGPTDASARTSWLKKQVSPSLTEDFRPQPWEQVIKVLREMGHPDEAEEVAIAKQDHIRKHTKLIKGSVRRSLHWCYGLFVGYGYRPLRIVYSMLGLWFACSLIFQAGAYYNYMGPSTPLLNNPQLAAQIEEQCGHAGQPGKTNWTKCPAVPAEYTTFYAPIYSLDLILPLVDLQQERDWAPIVSNELSEPMYWGRFLRWVMWLEILLGWVASLTLVAVLGRLVEKD
jgi:hypothetical protein